MKIRKEIFKTENMENIRDELYNLGISPILDGHWYWSLAIDIARNNDDLSLKMCEIYKKVAEECESSPTRVERAMRYAIAPIKEVIRLEYNYDYKIDNRAFLALMSHLNIGGK